MKGCQCTKAFYLWWHKAEEQFGDSAQARMDEGTLVGKLAQTLFPTGVDLNTLNLMPWELAGPTRDYMEQGLPVFEATFITEARPKRMCRVDILVPDGSGGWEIWEVKSATSVKEEYISDVAFQAYVTEQCGVRITKCVLMHINSDYVLNGELDVKGFFKIENITGRVMEEMEQVENNIEKYYRKSFDAHPPRVPIGGHCNAPYGCAFQHLCWANVPERDNIFVIPRLGSKADAYLRNEQYALSDLDPDELSEKQARVWEAHKEGLIIHDKEAIDQFFSDRPYPHYYLDFETVMPTIPIWQGTGPYDQIPFQYSLHVIREEGAEAEHYGYLHHPDGSDPRPALIEHMLQHIGEEGTVWAYNKSFETARINEMAAAFPSYNKALTLLEQRIHDLIIPFRSLWYYHPDMQGSNSIKDVLPVLVPELGYDNMLIGNGGEAMDVYLRLLKQDAEIMQSMDTYLDAMWKYCKLDTWAMVRIVFNLKQIN